MISRAELPYGAKYVPGGIFIPLAQVRQSDAESQRVRVQHPETGEGHSYIVPVTKVDRALALKKALWEVIRVCSAEKFIALKDSEAIKRKFEGK